MGGIIELKDVTKIYSTKDTPEIIALNKANLTVEEGDYVILLRNKTEATVQTVSDLSSLLLIYNQSGVKPSTDNLLAYIKTQKHLIQTEMSMFIAEMLLVISVLLIQLALHLLFVRHLSLILLKLKHIQMEKR